MDERRFRALFHSAIGEAPNPPDLQAMARRALSRPIERRASTLLEVLAAVAAMLIVAAIVGYNLVSHHLSTPAVQPSPVTTQKGAYQQLVSRDFQVLDGSFYAGSVCPVPALADGNQANPAPALPLDIPACRSKTIALLQSAQTMLTDLNSATIPPALAQSDASLRIDLETLISDLNGVVDALDHLRAADFDSNSANLAYDSVKNDVSRILR